MEIGADSVDFLRGVQAGFGAESDGAKAIGAMIEAIEKYGAVEVWFEV